MTKRISVSLEKRFPVQFVKYEKIGIFFFACSDEDYYYPYPFRRQMEDFVFNYFNETTNIVILPKCG
jgi:hypothetical protein